MTRFLTLTTAATLCFTPGSEASDKMPKAILKTSDGWRIETQQSLLEIKAYEGGYASQVYYGPKAGAVVNAEGYGMNEVSTRGGAVPERPVLELVFADGCRDTVLSFTKAEPLEIDGLPALRLDLTDKQYGLEVSSYYRVIAGQDIIEKWMVVRNGSDEKVLIENAQSGALGLPTDEYDLIHYSGTWGNEFVVERTKLTPGTKSIEVRTFREMKSPWFALRPHGEEDAEKGSVWFGGLKASCNWRMDFNKAYHGPVQISGGHNFWDTTWTLDSGEEFTTPKIVFGYTSEGMDGSADRMHQYIRHQVLPENFREKPRPVLYNSWYSTHFGVTVENQIALAEVAKEIGVELFVVDDGWFKGRTKDSTGLGDWTIDKERFPEGLKNLIQRINDMGMDFGIWVEPEMVNPDSDLYRAHPDWVLHYPKRERLTARNQLMLNLAREDVYEYLLKSLDDLLKENNIKFIKWDANRSVSEPGWPDAPKEMQREVRIRFVENLHRLFAELRKRHPDVIFENCASGGGRVDMGMMTYTDQNWISDISGGVERLSIQRGYLQAYPANTMVSWVLGDSHYGGQEGVPLSFQFHAAMCGVLGVGDTITKWTPEQRAEARGQIEKYKELRETIQNGRPYTLRSSDETGQEAVQYVKGDESVLFLFNVYNTMLRRTSSASASRNIKLKGLDPEATYVISNGFYGSYTGETLMTIGLPWFLTEEKTSAMLVLKKGRNLMTNARLASVTSAAAGHEGAKAMDGDPSTFWHSDWQVGAKPQPHELVVDLGETVSASGFYYLPRQNGSNGRIGRYEVLASDDGENWSAPFLTSEFNGSSSEKFVKFEQAKRARYFKFRILTEVNGLDLSSVAALGLF